MGVATVVAILAVVVVAATLFRGGFTDSVPVTVVSPRAGLVMNPGCQGADPRGPGRQGRLDRAVAQRRGRDPPGDGSDADERDTGERARRHRIHDGVRRQVRPIRHPTRPVAGIAATRPGARRQARDGRDQHGVREPHVGAVEDRSAEAQRSPRRHRAGRQRARREDRPDAVRSGRVPGEDRAEPARAESRSRGGPAGAAGLRRCRA